MSGGETPNHASFEDPELAALLKGIEVDQAAGIDVEAATAEAIADDTAPDVSDAPDLPAFDSSAFEGELGDLIKEAAQQQAQVKGEIEALILLANGKRGSRAQLAERLKKIQAGLIILQQRIDADTD